MKSSIAEKLRKANHIGISDYVKANRKGSRDAEIEYYGKQVSMAGPKLHKSKKQYVRHSKHRADWE